MKRYEEFSTALAITGAALGMDFATGRALSAFYAQLAGTSWLAVGLSAALFGLFAGLLSLLARRTGGDSLPAILRRLPGGRTGRAAQLLYGLIVLLAAGMLLSAAGHAGALALPMRHGALYGMGFALLAALALRGRRALRRACMAVAVLMALFETALLFAPEPDVTGLRFELELRLRNSVPAAILLALLHASACASVSAGLAVRLSGGRVRPLRLGLWAGLCFGMLLLVGNAALMVRPEQLRVLKLPFVALASGWGSMGFYASTALKFLAAATSLAALVPPWKSVEKRC